MKLHTDIYAANFAAPLPSDEDELLDALLRRSRALSADEIVIGKKGAVFRTQGLFYENIKLGSEHTRHLINRIGSLSHTDGKTRLCGSFVRRTARPISAAAVFLQNTVLLRLSGGSSALPPLEGIGLCGSQISKLRNIRSQKNGLVLFCSSDDHGISTAAASVVFDMRYGKNEAGKKMPRIRYIYDSESGRAAIRAARAHFVFASIGAPDTDAGFALLKKYNGGKIAPALRCIIARELLYDGRDIRMLFDIAFPKDPPETEAKRPPCDPRAGDSFVHCTNVASEILKSLKLHARPVRTAEAGISYRKKIAEEAAR